MPRETRILDVNAREKDKEFALEQARGVATDLGKIVLDNAKTRFEWSNKNPIKEGLKMIAALVDRSIADLRVRFWYTPFQEARAHVIANRLLQAHESTGVWLPANMYYVARAVRNAKDQTEVNAAIARLSGRKKHGDTKTRFDALRKAQTAKEKKVEEAQESLLADPDLAKRQGAIILQNDASTIHIHPDGRAEQLDRAINAIVSHYRDEIVNHNQPLTPAFVLQQLRHLLRGADRADVENLLQQVSANLTLQKVAEAVSYQTTRMARGLESVDAYIHANTDRLIGNAATQAMVRDKGGLVSWLYDRPVLRYIPDATGIFGRNARVRAQAVTGIILGATIGTAAVMGAPLVFGGGAVVATIALASRTFNAIHKRGIAQQQRERNKILGTTKTPLELLYATDNQTAIYQQRDLHRFGPKIMYRAANDEYQTATLDKPDEPRKPYAVDAEALLKRAEILITTFTSGTPTHDDITAAVETLVHMEAGLQFFYETGEDPFTRVRGTADIVDVVGLLGDRIEELYYNLSSLHPPIPNLDAALQTMENNQIANSLNQRAISQGGKAFTHIIPAQNLIYDVPKVNRSIVINVPNVGPTINKDMRNFAEMQYIECAARLYLFNITGEAYFSTGSSEDFIETVGKLQQIALDGRNLLMNAESAVGGDLRAYNAHLDARLQNKIQELYRQRNRDEAVLRRNRTLSGGVSFLVNAAAIFIGMSGGEVAASAL